MASSLGARVCSPSVTYLGVPICRVIFGILGRVLWRGQAGD
jgi:hypothetical protein